MSDFFAFPSNSSDILEKMGFIRIVGWCRKGEYIFATKKFPNYKQWESITNFCLIKDQTIPKWNNRYGFKN